MCNSGVLNPSCIEPYVSHILRLRVAKPLQPQGLFDCINNPNNTINQPPIPSTIVNSWRLVIGVIQRLPKGRWTVGGILGLLDLPLGEATTE